MAVLTTKVRDALPKADFGLPGARSFPMPDKSHAANAKGRATQAVKAGRMSPSTEHKIDAHADKVMSGRHGGVIGKVSAGKMGHAKQTAEPVTTARGEFRIKG